MKDEYGQTLQALHIHVPTIRPKHAVTIPRRKSHREGPVYYFLSELTMEA